MNSEGELPLDVATEDAMERLLKGEIKKQGEESLCTNIKHLPSHVKSSVSSCQACWDMAVHVVFMSNNKYTATTICDMFMLSTD